MYSYCKVKVALSGGMLALSLAMHTAWAQHSPADRDQAITLSCTEVKFDEVLRRLEKQADVHFVYSPNVVKTDKPVSLSVYDRPLEEILGLIGGQANVLFRRQGRYVVVKKSPPAEVKNTGKKTGVSPLRLKQEALAGDNKVAEDEKAAVEGPVPAFSFNDDMTHRDVMLKDLPWSMQDLVVYDTAFLYKYQRTLIRMDRRHTPGPWFASVGLFANDFTLSSFEGRAGHKHFYAVVNAGVLGDLSYRVSYGAGTSFSISRKISLYPIYTYARLNRTQDLELTRGDRFIAVKDGYRVEAQHHQGKLMVQFRLTPKIDLQLGPTYNMLAAEYQVNVPPRPAQRVVIIAEYEGKGEYTGNVIKDVSTTSSNTTFTPDSHHTFKSWLGVEVGVSYRINFAR